MKRASSMEAVAQELECTICGSVFVDPRVLQCQHVFCLRCLFALINRDRSKSVTVHCPFACPELTVVPGGLRNLKKNPIIASLSRNTRSRMYAMMDPASMACDWCSKENTACSMCDRCNSYICTACSATPHSSDHGFLCQLPPPALSVDAAAAESSAVDMSAPAVSPSEPQTGMPFLFPSRIAKRKIHEALQSRLLSPSPTSLPCEVDSPEGILVPHYLQQCLCTTTTQDGIDIERKIQVLIPPRSLSRHTSPEYAEEEKMWDSVELTMLANCLIVIAKVETAVDDVILCLTQATKSIRVSCSPTDLSLASHVAVNARQIHDVLSYIIAPMLHRVALFANLAGHKYAERLCQIFTHSPSQERKSHIRRLRAYVLLSMNLGSEVQQSIMDLSGRLEHDLRRNITALEHWIASRTSTALSHAVIANGPQRRRVSPLMRMAWQLEKQLSSMTTVFESLEVLHGILHAEQQEATRGVGLDETSRDRILSLEKSLRDEADKIAGICGSTQHLRVLWLQCGAAFGKEFESTNLVDVLRQCKGRFGIGSPLTVPGVDQTIREASSLVSSISPQVQGLRKKIVSVLQQSPTNLNMVSVLLEQYSKLSSQVLNLHQKGHYIAQLEVGKQATTYLLSCTSVIIACFVRSHSEHVVREVFSEETIGNLLEPTDTPHGQMSQRLTRLGSYLNKACQPLSMSERDGLLGYVQKLGQCAAVALKIASTQQIRGSSPQLESSIPSNVTTADQIDAEPYDEECKTFVIERAQKRVKIDVPNLKSRAVVVTLGPVEKVLLPFYHGFYRVTGRCPNQVFEYFFDAQTGEMIIEDPPETRRETFFKFVNRAMESKMCFCAVTAAMVAFGPLINKKLML